jgi:hypothetical protein
VVSGAETVSLANAFTVTNGTPAITLVNPNTGQQGQTNLAVTITGSFTRFTTASVVTFSGSGVTAGVPSAATATSLTVPVTIAANAPLGAQGIQVVSGAETVGLANAFTVTAGTPAITLVNPNTGQQGQTNLAVNLTGQFTHWAQGTSTASFGAGITVASLTVDSATSASAMLTIGPAAVMGPFAFGSVLIGNPSLGFVQLFSTTSANGLGTSSPSTALALNDVTVSSLGGPFTSSLPVGTVLEVLVTDASFTSDNNGPGFTLTQPPGGCTGQPPNNCFVIPISGVSPLNTQSGPSFTLSKALQPTDTLSLNATGTACLQPNGTYCTNAAGVIVVAGSSPVGASNLDYTDTAFYNGTASSATATPGARNVSVITGSEAAALTNGFTVMPGTPLITLVSPSGSLQDISRFRGKPFLGKALHVVPGMT